MTLIAEPPVETPHEHEWRLLAFEFEDGRSVGSFECAGCQQVTYR